MLYQDCNLRLSSDRVTRACHIKNYCQIKPVSSTDMTWVKRFNLNELINLSVHHLSWRTACKVVHIPLNIIASMSAIMFPPVLRNEKSVVSGLPAVFRYFDLIMFSWLSWCVKLDLNCSSFIYLVESGNAAWSGNQWAANYDVSDQNQATNTTIQNRKGSITKLQHFFVCS